MISGKDVRPGNWSNVTDLYDNGDFSVIWGNYDGNPKKSLGTRWNGAWDKDDMGYPKTFGNPVWYVEPDILAKGILLTLLEFTLRNPNSGGNKDAIIAALAECFRSA
ncbi:MAG: hypothetical protein J6Z49_10065 [Kiritimatiellae bacterium]|nr:hypothetical protein [Kiritimatiellia bacterium]